MQDLYNTNKDFKAYVDRYCNNSHEGKGCRLEEALEHELVKQNSLLGRWISLISRRCYHNNSGAGNTAPEGEEHGQNKL